MPQYRRFQIRGGEQDSYTVAPHFIGPADPNEQANATLVLRRPNSELLEQKIRAMSGTSASKPVYMTREQFAQEHSIQPETLQRIEEFARDHGLIVADIQKEAGTVTVAGPVSALEGAFGVKLHNYSAGDFTFHAKSGDPTLPAGVSELVESVVGFDSRPAADPHFQIAGNGGGGIAFRNFPTNAFTPLDLAKLYNFPDNLDGAGQTIAILELNVPNSTDPRQFGGYRMKDLNEYFQSLSLPTPAITDVSVLGETNRPSGSPSGVDGEVVLDIEVAGAIAPGAHIAVYFAPNTKQGFLTGINTAIHDSVNKPSVLSISWGSAEASWSKDEATAFERAFQDAAALGVTVFVAAGDGGSSDGLLDGRAHVDFPGSAPHATCCGGTQLLVNSSNQIEDVWNDNPTSSATGGGVSDLFDPPLYQVGASVPPSANPEHRIGRGTPDLSADASPATGYRVRIDGQDLVLGGTSAVAPLCAGLIALINQKLGRQVGFINPALYQNPASLRDVRTGNNGAYKAGTGWDACTGLGSLDGGKLLQVL